MSKKSNSTPKTQPSGVPKNKPGAGQVRIKGSVPSMRNPPPPPKKKS